MTADDFIGEVVDAGIAYSPSTGFTVPKGVVLVFSDGREVEIKADTFHFDQYSTDPCLSLETR